MAFPEISDEQVDKAIAMSVVSTKLLRIMRSVPPHKRPAVLQFVQTIVELDEVEAQRKTPSITGPS